MEQTADPVPSSPPNEYDHRGCVEPAVPLNKVLAAQPPSAVRTTSTNTIVERPDHQHQ